MKRLSAILVSSLLLAGAGCLDRAPAVRTAAQVPVEEPAAQVAPEHVPTDAAPPTPEVRAIFADPLPDALSRVTKKPFGILIDRATSPVQPERFSGYHSGTDFETSPDEQDADVPVAAVCDGTLALKKYATGYGGVAVERCELDGQAITVIYGHLRLSSVTPEVGQAMRRGEPFALLGTGFGKETDGERKHLHLGIHRGSSIVLLGYVQSKAALDDWFDAATLLR